MAAINFDSPGSKKQVKVVRRSGRPDPEPDYKGDQCCQ